MTAASADRIPVGTGKDRLWLLASLLALAVLAVLVTGTTQRGWTPGARIHVQLGADHYRVETAEAASLETFSRDYFATGAAAARTVLQRELTASVTQTFDQVRERLPEFADWYYSLGGEYSRLSMAALARLNLAEDGYVARRVEEMLFPDPAWQTALAQLSADAAGRLQVQGQALREGWLAELARRLEPDRVPAPLPGGAPAPVVTFRPAVFAATLQAQEQEIFAARLGLSTVAAAGVAARVAWQSAAARQAAVMGRAAGARVAGRGLGRAGAAAGGGMTACAAAGPYALGCAVVAGAVAWLATDWVLLRVDEALHRDTLLAALEHGLAEVEQQVQVAMLAAHDEAAAAYRAHVDEEIAMTFEPLRAGVAQP